jgi:hypothetical protein
VSSRAVMRCRVPGRRWTASPGSSSNDSSGAFGITHLEQKSARLNRDRLLLLLVILKRERVTRIDVQRLSAVATVDEREMFFVSPRFFD